MRASLLATAALLPNSSSIYLVGNRGFAKFQAGVKADVILRWPISPRSLGTRPRTVKGLGCTIPNPVDILTHFDLITPEARLDGTLVLQIPEDERARKREVRHRDRFQSQVSRGGSGTIKFPPEFRILTEQVDVLVGSGIVQDRPDAGSEEDRGSVEV